MRTWRTTAGLPFGLALMALGSLLPPVSLGEVPAQQKDAPASVPAAAEAGSAHQAPPAGDAAGDSASHPAPPSGQASDAGAAHHEPQAGDAVGEEVDRWIHLFESPDREMWQRPAQVVAALLLKPGQKVADIGAGSGYFSRRLAQAVGPKGTVWAVDIEPGMLRYIHKTAREQGLTNVVTILAAEDDPMLPPAESDLIFICDTLHHIQDRVGYLRLLRRYLRPHGRLAIVDYHKEELPIGPPPALKLGRATVLSEAKEAGFKLKTEHLFLPYQYFLVLTPD